MAEDLTCSVCSQQFSEPRILPCCHTFCLKCMEKTVGDPEKKEEITCPQCRKIHAIPADGLQGFVTDFSISHAIEASGLAATQETVCGECEGEGPVESYCTDCQAYLCKECSTQAHKKYKPYRGHKVIPVQDLNAASLQSSKVHYCNTHSSEVMKLYCETCKKLVCRECYLVDHHQHSYKSVEDARKQLSDQLASLVEDGKQKLAAFKVNLEEIQKVEISAARYPDVLKAQINAFFDDVIQSAEKRRQQLLAQAESECHTDLRQIWRDRVFHQAAIPEAEDALRLADKATKCTSDVEMILTALQSIRQLSELQALKWNYSKFTDIVPCPWTFKKTLLETDKAGGIERTSGSYTVAVRDLPSVYRGSSYWYETELGKTVTFRIVPYLVDRRSQKNVGLMMKASVLIKYTYSNKVLNTTSLAFKSDGSYEVTMRPVYSGYLTLEVKYDDESVKDSPFRVEVTGIPKVGDRVKKGPDWKNSNLHVKEGTVQSVKDKTLSVVWDDVDGVHKYKWDAYGKPEVELV